MAHHVFLTGAKRVGKSTLLKKVLALSSEAPGGFRTVRTRECRQDLWTVHMLPADGSSLPGEENLLFVCGHQDRNTASRFDLLGTELLGSSASHSLILMDELGPHEEAAQMFHRAVWAVLDGDIPVLGVLQEPLSPFLQQIAQRGDVAILTVTEQNRNDPEFPQRILSLLK